MSDIVIGLIMVQKAKIDGNNVEWKTFKPTQGHADFLKKLGYTVRDDLHQDSRGRYIQVECTGFEAVKINTTLDGDEGLAEVEKLKAIIKEKKLISYPSNNGSQFIFLGNDGKVNDGTASRMVGAVRYLDRIVKGGSALVAKRKENESKSKTATATFDISDLLG